MRIRPEQLAAHLRRSPGTAWLVSGDEPLQLEEACDAIRLAARNHGFSERETLLAGTGFDWSALQQTSQSLSLFASKRLIEIRLPTGKPGEAGNAALVDYLAHPDPDLLLLVICPKLDAASQKSKWFTALDKVGAIVQIWPIAPAQLPDWITQRMQAKGMQASRDAAALLAERVEGNLLAAAQDVDKLFLLHGPARIDLDAVTQAVTDSSRFDIYALVDSALGGDATRTTRILTGLRGEGVDAILVLWAIAREARTLASMAYACEGGMSVDEALVKFKVWDKRKPLLKLALRRHRLVLWHQVLRQASHIDRVIKGLRVGNVWDELLRLSLSIAGIVQMK